MAVCEWLRMEEPDLYRNGIFKLVPVLDKCIIVRTDCADKYSGSRGQNRLVQLLTGKEGYVDANAYGAPSSPNKHTFRHTTVNSLTQHHVYCVRLHL